MVKSRTNVSLKHCVRLYTKKKQKKGKQLFVDTTNIFSEMLHKKTRFFKEDGWGSVKEKKKNLLGRSYLQVICTQSELSLKMCTICQKEMVEK
jgi:hypothetical protein